MRNIWFIFIFFKKKDCNHNELSNYFLIITNLMVVALLVIIGIYIPCILKYEILIKLVPTCNMQQQYELQYIMIIIND